MDEDLINARLGNYYIRRLLGSGGFADVYLGEHIHLKTLAAIKLSQEIQRDMPSFVREARLLASLRHPHIVSVLEFDLYHSRPFLVMEYHPHGTLAQRFPHSSRLPVETVLTCMRQIAEALDYLHERGLAHGDIKPENILLGEGDHLYVTDFGLAILTGQQQGQTLVGTIDYMAPEQLQHQLQPASDQYALGIMAYEWLCGSPPFTGTYAEIATQHAFTPPVPLRRHVPTLPVEVEAVILRALSKEPGQRYASAGAFVSALGEAYDGSLPTVRRPLLPSAQPASVAGKTKDHPSYSTQPAFSLSLPARTKISRRALLIAGVSGLATLGLIGTGSLLWWRNASSTQKGYGQPEPPATPPPGSLYTIYHGQNAAIDMLAWSPGGTRIASASNDSSSNKYLIHVWDALTGRHPIEYRGHASAISVLAWSPDGIYIASGSVGANTAIQIWESATGKQVASLESDHDTITQLYWQATTRILAIGGTSGQLMLWNPLTKINSSQRFAGENVDTLDTCSVSPDGKYLITSASGKVYRLSDGYQISTDKTEGGFGPTFPYFWSPNSQRCITLHYRWPPEVWNPLTGQSLATFERPGYAYTIAWSPDSQKVASYGQASELFLWNASTGTTIFTYAPHAPDVYSIAWSPDGHLIANGGSNGIVEVWQAL